MTAAIQDQTQEKRVATLIHPEHPSSDWHKESHQMSPRMADTEHCGLKGFHRVSHPATILARLAYVCLRHQDCPLPHSPGEDSFRPIRSLALWILSRHMACSFLKMQSECIAIACRIWGTDDERARSPLTAPLLQLRRRALGTEVQEGDQPTSAPLQKP